MAFTDAFNIKTTNVKFNDIADAIDGALSRVNGGTTSGTSTAYSVTCSPAWAAYEQGRILTFVPHTTNTGSSTINANGLGTRTLKNKNNNLIGGELVAGVTAVVCITAADAELLNPAMAWKSWNPTGAGAFPSVLTVNFAWYQRIGNLVHFQYNVQATTTSTAPNCSVILPVAASAVGAVQSFAASVTDGGTFKGGFGFITTASTTSDVYKYDASNFTSGVSVVARGGGTYIV